MADSLELPLLGLKVVDFTRLLPGPYASLVLADLGASVIKVEPSRGGDYLRWMPPLTGERRMSWPFASLNSGKRSLALDLKRPEGLEVALKLVDDADVLLEQFRPGVMARLGMGYEALERRNPRLVYCAISGFGQDGPYRDRPGHDLNYQGLAGVIGMAGPADGPPAMPAAQLADIGAGSLWPLIGVLTALVARGVSGRGRLVDASMTDGSLAFLHMALSAYLGTGDNPPKRGLEVLTGGQACYGIYQTKDGGYMTLGALEPKFWHAFCRAAKRPDLIGRHFGNPEQVERTRADLAKLFAKKTRAEWEELLADADCCCEPVLRPEELESHPLHVGRANFLKDATGMTRLRTPLRPTDAPPPEGAPMLGEHTREILGEMGYEEAAIDALVESGAVAEPAG